MRRLRFGMVGGGIGAYIGDSHRFGAQMNDLSQLCAGCFSRDSEKNRRTAQLWNMPDMDRVYASWQEMAEKEAEREDGIDFVTIVTPNDTHYAIARAFMEKGIHVLCDKPLTLTVEEAEDLERIAKEKDLLFGLSYAYTAYPVIHQARKMIESGTIGDILHVRVGHPEEWVIDSVPEDPDGKPLGWRFQPEHGGPSLCTSDIGCHAEQLLVQFTGLRIQRVLAMLDRYPRYLEQETNTTVLLDLGNGITGDLWASQIAIGKSCDPYIFVIGSKGSLEWNHRNPDDLLYTPRNCPTQRMEAGKSYMGETCNRYARVDAGHHIGFYEAFGNIYKAFCEALVDKLNGSSSCNYDFPTIHEGVDSVRFIKACLESQHQGNSWIALKR